MFQFGRPYPEKAAKIEVGGHVASFRRPVSNRVSKWYLDYYSRKFYVITGKNSAYVA